MRRANEGDAQAYRELLVEVGEVIERYLRRRFGDSDFVEDCAQECLLAIHRARQSYDPARRFRAWMFAIVRHKAIDLLRRRGTRARHETASVPDVELHAAPPSDPSAGIDAAELLGRLDPKYRDALVLTKLHGHSLAEAADEMNVSVTAMKSRVSRGLRLVRALLDGEPD